MRFQMLDEVVLKRDLPEFALRAGDVGTVVFIYDDNGLEVEFMTASGQTTAVTTLADEDVRPAADDDQLTVRPRH